MKNKRVVNMSGVKKDQGGVEEETSTSKWTGASHSHFRVGLATDLKRCFVPASWSQSPKNIRVWEAFSFLGRLTITLKFSMEFNKKIKNKGSLRQRADPLPSTPPTISLCLSYRCSACHRVSVQQVQWLAKSTWKGEMWQVLKKRKNGYLHLNLTM